VFQMNTVISTIHRRRSIRKFKKTPVGTNLVRELLVAAQRAPSGCNFQPYCFIEVKGKAKRTQLLKAIGSFVWSASFASAPIWIVVCVDLYRLRRLIESQGLRYRSYLGYKVRSIVDASMATENLVIAAESVGLSTLIVGMVFESMVDVSRILSLPQEVTPLLMVCIGYPDENPPLRPRWPLKKIRFTNEYRRITNKDLVEYVKSMNRFQKTEGRIAGGYKDRLERLMHTPIKNRRNETRIRRMLHRNGLSL